MKPLILLVLLVFFSTFQEAERAEPDLLVLKFNWAREKQSSRVIRGAQNPGGPITTPVPDSRDLGSRKADLRTMEKKAAVSVGNAPENYQLRLELKNKGAGAVKGFIWEYRPTAGPDDYRPKQYLCALQVKPKEKKTLELWTPYVPVKVISAGERKEKLEEGTVVINQVQYADGSVWTKTGWNYKLPADSLQKLAEGKCSVF